MTKSFKQKLLTCVNINKFNMWHATDVNEILSRKTFQYWERKFTCNMNYGILA